MTNDLARLTLAMKIRMAGCVTRDMCNEAFKGLKEEEIRQNLEEIGVERNTPIETIAVEVAVVTENGVFLKNYENGMLSLWRFEYNGRSGDSIAVKGLFDEGVVDKFATACYIETADYPLQNNSGRKRILHAYRYELESDVLESALSKGKFLKTADDLDKVITENRSFVAKLLKKMN